MPVPVLDAETLRERNRVMVSYPQRMPSP